MVMTLWTIAPLTSQLSLNRAQCTSRISLDLSDLSLGLPTGFPSETRSTSASWSSSRRRTESRVLRTPSPVPVRQKSATTKSVAKSPSATRKSSTPISMEELPHTSARQRPASLRRRTINSQDQETPRPNKSQQKVISRRKDSSWASENDSTPTNISKRRDRHLQHSTPITAIQNRHYEPEEDLFNNYAESDTPQVLPHSSGPAGAGSSRADKRKEHTAREQRTRSSSVSHKSVHANVGRAVTPLRALSLQNDEAETEGPAGDGIHCQSSRAPRHHSRSHSSQAGGETSETSDFSQRHLSELYTPKVVKSWISDHVKMNALSSVTKEITGKPNKSYGYIYVICKAGGGGYVMSTTEDGESGSRGPSMEPPCFRRKDGLEVSLIWALTRQTRDWGSYASASPEGNLVEKLQIKIGSAMDIRNRLSRLKSECKFDPILLLLYDNDNDTDAYPLKDPVPLRHHKSSPCPQDGPSNSSRHPARRASAIRRGNPGTSPCGQQWCSL